MKTLALRRQRRQGLPSDGDGRRSRILDAYELKWGRWMVGRDSNILGNPTARTNKRMRAHFINPKLGMQRSFAACGYSRPTWEWNENGSPGFYEEVRCGVCAGIVARSR